MIMNTVLSDKKSSHWSSFLKFYNKKKILFDSFGFNRLNEFIIGKDKKLYRTYYLIQKKLIKNNKINLVSLRLFVKTYEKISKETQLKLTTTAADLFHELESDTCAFF